MRFRPSQPPLHFQPSTTAGVIAAYARSNGVLDKAKYWGGIAYLIAYWPVNLGIWQMLQIQEQVTWEANRSSVEATAEKALSSAQSGMYFPSFQEELSWMGREYPQVLVFGPVSTEIARLKGGATLATLAMLLPPADAKRAELVEVAESEIKSAGRLWSWESSDWEDIKPIVEATLLHMVRLVEYVRTHQLDSTTRQALTQGLKYFFKTYGIAYSESGVARAQEQQDDKSPSEYFLDVHVGDPDGGEVSWLDKLLCALGLMDCPPGFDPSAWRWKLGLAAGGTALLVGAYFISPYIMILLQTRHMARMERRVYRRQMFRDRRQKKISQKLLTREKVRQEQRAITRQRKAAAKAAATGAALAASGGQKAPAVARKKLASPAKRALQKQTQTPEEVA